MFTGIIQKVATVIETNANQLKITNPYSTESVKDPIELGESISNNGVCLTVAAFAETFLQFDLSPATLEVTALGRLKKGSKVNLERSLRMGDRLSGHWVQGHVDGTAEVVSIQEVEKGFYDLVVLPREDSSHASILRYCVKKGSLSVDGISLTIQDLSTAQESTKTLKFQIIPHTWSETALSDLKNGDLVNIEVDILAKYIEQMAYFTKAL